MATTTKSRGRSSTGPSNSSNNAKATRARSGAARQAKPADSSAFSWGNKQAGALIGAAVAGAAVGFAANLGRKFFMQFGTHPNADWVEALTAEHELALAIFDKIEATDDSQTHQRTALLGKLKYALTKHALEEENVIYPALRNAESRAEADDLDGEHAEVKTYLYELENLEKDSPVWLTRVRLFRAMIEKHMREEENEIFPQLRDRLSDEENARLTAAMNKEGFKFA